MKFNKNYPVSPFRTLTNFPTLFPSEIFDDLERFLGDLDLFDPSTSNLRISKGFPKGDLFLEDGNLVIELALAGYSKDQLSVRVENSGSIVVSAEKKSEGDGDETGRGGRSLARRAFQRVFPQLGKEWDVASSDVTYRDGLLRIVVPPIEPVKEETLQELEIK